MMEYAAKTPTIPIPFHRLLKVVAVGDVSDRAAQALLGRLAEEKFEVETDDRYDRDVLEDAAVGAYIVAIDGAQLEPARNLARAVRGAGFSTPLWALADSRRLSQTLSPEVIGELDGCIFLGQQTPAFQAKQLIASVTEYGLSLLPPFFGGLMAYDSEANISFACPGHQGGEFYRKSPAGQLFFQHFGEQLFRNDLCNADVDLGDLLIHVGAAVEAQRHAARVFGADRTYFVLNGTSTANKIVAHAVLRRGDLVLFDRNNHKSLHQGALVQAGAVPIFLPTARNPFGMIGAIDWDALDENSLREQIRRQPLARERADRERPFRLACIQLATYDGTVYNCRKVMEKIGHLCDYVLWDEAWIGYNAFHPLFADHSPMRLPQPGPQTAGLFSTQSVHKQGAGFSQASQIHKRDEHIRGQRRFIEHKRFNESFLMHASTSPFYPLFASLDVNAKVHAGKAGEMLWDRCIELGIETRKKLRELSRHFERNGADREEQWFFDPFVPDVVTIRGSRFTQDVQNARWEELPTDLIKREQQCWTFDPAAAWHGYQGYAPGYAMVDPNKLMLLTPGIERRTGQYLDFGVPATVLANYLREQRIVPEKCDLNSILFLMTLTEVANRIAATLALIYPPGIGVIVPGERWDAKAKPMLDYFLVFEESFNRFPGFNYEVQGVYQEQGDGRIKFHTYVVRE